MANRRRGVALDRLEQIQKPVREILAESGATRDETTLALAVMHVALQIAATGHDYRCWDMSVLVETGFLRRRLPHPSPARVLAVERLVKLEARPRSNSTTKPAWLPDARLMEFEPEFYPAAYVWVRRRGTRYAFERRYAVNRDEHKYLAIAAIWRATRG